MELKIDEAITTIEAGLVGALAKSGALIERSAKIYCPVDTGNLRASIHTDLDASNLSTSIGSNVEYAPYVEAGRNAQPFLKPALEENIEAIIRQFEGII